MDHKRPKSKHDHHRDPHRPNFAPGLENDDLEAEASKKDKQQGNSTSVTQAYIDRL